MSGFVRNREGFAMLLSWLENGAPHVTLNMDQGVKLTTHDVSGPGECGSTCCIAGAASQMAEGTFGHINVKDFFNEHSSYAVWIGVPEKAVAFLDVDLETLPEQAVSYDYGKPEMDDRGWYILDLFNDKLAPDYCTGAEAAQALRNFDETGNAHWDTVRKEEEDTCDLN